MIVDTSALICIALDEPMASAVWQALARAQDPTVSAANLLESWMVVDRRNADVAQRLDALLVDAGLSVAPVTREHVTIARDAFRVYGKGSGHKAQLNFGDCIAYGLAKSMNEPLLFIGNDFIHTDLVPALASASE